MVATYGNINVVPDPKVPFGAYFIRGNKRDQRRHVADQATSWLRLQKARGASGAVMIDIDDTIVDGHESVQHGFEFMRELVREVGLAFPIHVVTARPNDQHSYVMGMLQERQLGVPPDRLHMLPRELYGADTVHVEKFKWATCLKICRLHHGIVARFGDKLWDVATFDSLRTYLGHVGDKHCYIFLDPQQKGCFSGKLPGA